VTAPTLLEMGFFTIQKRLIVVQCSGMFGTIRKTCRKLLFARDEAPKVGSSCVEQEHILLGIMRSCELELDQLFKLKW
jgi:hypothetical protein